MFHNGRKTIGVFLNRAELAFQQNLSKHLIAAAKEKNYNVAFMTSYGVRGMTSEYDVNESDIVDFAPIEKFAAIVVAFDTYDTPIFRTKLVSAIKQRANGPVISFREKTEDFYNVITDANIEIEKIVEHFVTEHHAKHICFMAGYDGHYDSNKRLEHYYNAMARLNLPIYKNSVFYGDMWTRKGEEAYEFFFSNPNRKPDAIICANDFMARSLCEAIIRHGKKVPEDVLISGFDNAIESREYSPQLTTVGLDYEKMAWETVELLHDILQGKTREKDTYVSSAVIYRESCGCLNSELERAPEYSQLKTANEVLDQHMEQMYFSIDMNGCNTLEDITRTIGNSLKMVGDYDEFYLCRFCDHNTQYGINSLVGNMPTKMEFGFRNGKRIEKDVEFYQKDLLPKEVSDDSLKVYYFRILHNREKSFGYTVISYINRTDSLYAFYHDWNLTISLTLNDYYVRQQMEELIAINKDNSLKDYMTKVYNRLGLDDYLEKHWDEWMSGGKYLSFLSVDLDGLKKINDTYGHAEGDWVICHLADVLRISAKGYGIVARTGGDEFLMVVCDDKQGLSTYIKENIQRMLLELNEKSNKSYLVDCSIGEHTVKMNRNISLQECIWNSDMEMYKIKKKKGSSRND